MHDMELQAPTELLPALFALLETESDARFTALRRQVLTLIREEVPRTTPTLP